MPDEEQAGESPEQPPAAEAKPERPARAEKPEAKVEAKQAPPAGSIADAFKAAMPGVTFEAYQGLSDVIIEVQRDDISKVMPVAKDDARLDLKFLRCLFGVDHEADGFDVVYQLMSLEKAHHVTIKTRLPRDDAKVASVTPIWNAANWHERETRDMFGIDFVGHPHLLPLLLPEDMTDHYPLRKDNALVEVEALAFAAAGCGSSPKNDHDAITRLWKDYFGAIESGNAGALGKLYSDQCDNGDELKALITVTRSLAETEDFKVTDVELQNLSGEKAESKPIGQEIFRGDARPMESDSFAKLVKEHGRWKFAECDILGGGFFEQSATPTPASGSGGAGQ
jgi:NADH-quinone oxidoreductase subunit C